MSISMIHSALKMTATVPNVKSVSHSNNNVQQRVAQAWQDNPAGKISTEKNGSALQPSTTGQSAIDDFVESLRTTQDKKALFGLLNRKLISLSSTERTTFITGLVATLNTSEVPGDNTLLKEKFDPAYAMYIANNMLLTQMKEEVFSKMGRVPDEDDEESDEI